MKLTIDQFLAFFNGIYADYDGAYGDQCFDLANLYSRWISGQRFTGATADLIFNQPGDFYEQIKNTPDGIPQKGDIIIWKWPHVGIATGNNSSTSQFEVLEQNDPTDSNCHIKVYLNYNGVIGWLRPKVVPQNQQAELDQLRTDRDRNWNLYQDEIKKNADLNNQLTIAKDALTICQNKIVSIIDYQVASSSQAPKVTNVASSQDNTTSATLASQTENTVSINAFSRFLNWLFSK